MNQRSNRRKKELRALMKRSKGRTVGIVGAEQIHMQLEKLAIDLKNTTSVLVGVHRSAGMYDEGLHTAYIAAIHEFGDDDHNIPERSFLRAGINASKKDIIKLYAKQLPLVVQGRIALKSIQHFVGELVVGNITQRIADGIPPPLKPETVRRKKSSKPLIDTGHLRQSITYEVVSEAADKDTV